MAKHNHLFSHKDRKVIAGVGLTVVIIVGVMTVLFSPLQSFFIVSPIDQQEILDRANTELEQINALQIPFCNDVSDCQEGFKIINRTLIEEIVNPIEEGVQESDTTLVIDGEDVTIVKDAEIIGQIPEPQPELEPVSMELISIVIKTDNTGKQTESKTNTGIPLLTFFVEDTSNIDFDNGVLEQSLMIKTENEIEATINAKLDIQINQKSILVNPIIISSKGVTDNNGELLLDFKSTTGISSKTYLFKFRDNISRFNATGISKVEFILSEITIDATNQKFSLSNSTIYSMNIARDPNRILIKDEAGGLLRVFPVDDGLGIGSSVGSITTTYCFNRTFYSCIQYSSYTHCTQAPAMGGGTVTHIKKDGTSEIINTFGASGAGAMNPNNQQSGCGGVTKVSMIIQRDEIYKIDFQNPVGSVKFKTPMEKKDYYFYCKSDTTFYCNYNDKTVIDSLTASLGQWLKLTKFKLNARAFGGLGLLLIGLILILPLWAGLIETGIIGDVPSNVVQVEEGVRHQLPSSISMMLLIFMVVSFLAFVYIYKVKKKRERK